MNQINFGNLFIVTVILKKSNKHKCSGSNISNYSVRWFSLSSVRLNDITLISGNFFKLRTHLRGKFFNLNFFLIQILKKRGNFYRG